MLSAHLSALETKHADLDRQIADEERRPRPDEMTIAELKKRKLKLKEAMTH